MQMQCQGWLISDASRQHVWGGAAGGSLSWTRYASSVWARTAIRTCLLQLTSWQGSHCFVSLACAERPAAARRRYRGKGLMAEIPSESAGQASSDPPMRVYAISDLHTDYEANMEWVKRLALDRYLQDALIVAGDVSDDLQVFRETLMLLKQRFKHVFFVPGNHDLWCRREEDHQVDSLAKLQTLNTICKSLGVETDPKKVDTVWIVPLFSWYHQSFDRERDIESHSFAPPEKKCTDYRACKWPSIMDSSADDLASYFDELNAVHEELVEDIRASRSPVITFSHFLPRVELCPEKRMLFYPNLLKVVGSDWLEARVRKIHGPSGSPSSCHVFGHTHFCWDATLEGVRYIQAPLAYPRERERGLIGAEKWLPLCVYESETGVIGSLPLPCPWSDHYRTHKRDPDNIELAPWVIEHLLPVRN